MDQLKEIFDLLNLGAPFYYAFAALTLFYFFDSQASERANRAISNWLESTDYDASDVSRALVELFDRIYTYPLWQWRAVARCIAISTVVTAVTIWQMYYPTFYFMMYSCCGITDQFSQQIVINIISDYLSLYLVRHWLKSLRFPIIALILAPILEVLAVLILYTVGDVLRFSLETVTFHPRYFVEGMSWWVEVLGTPGISSQKAILVGALAVHVWLPLFAFGVMIARGLNTGRRAAVGMQWFLKAGDKHLRAIGFVTAAVAFSVTAILQYGFM